MRKIGNRQGKKHDRGVIIFIAWVARLGNYPRASSVVTLGDDGQMVSSIFADPSCGEWADGHSSTYQGKRIIILRWEFFAI